jgi:transposase
VAANDRQAVAFLLSGGQAGDGPLGRELMEKMEAQRRESGCKFWHARGRKCGLAMDRAYQGNETRALARKLGFKPIGPPNPQRKKPWKYDKKLYRRRNEIERLFRKLDGLRRIFTRYDKLDIIYANSIFLALIFYELK